MEFLCCLVFLLGFEKRVFEMVKCGFVCLNRKKVFYIIIPCICAVYSLTNETRTLYATGAMQSEINDGHSLTTVLHHLFLRKSSVKLRKI